MCISGPYAQDPIAHRSWGVFKAIRESDTNEQNCNTALVKEVLERAGGMLLSVSLGNSAWRLRASAKSGLCFFLLPWEVRSPQARITLSESGRNDAGIWAGEDEAAVRELRPVGDL